MFNQLSSFLAQYPILATLARIAVAFILAYLLHRLSRRIAGRIMQLNRFSRPERRLRPERRKTVTALVGSAISALGLLVATLFSLGQFVGVDTLVWMVGLFSAAFGLGARPLLADFLTGLSFIFEDQFDVGEKVELLGVEGVIEAVNLRTLLLRSPSGELYIVPNGDVRLVRNFSRGRFSLARATVTVKAPDLNRAVSLLEELGQEAMYLLPNLLEPWQVFTESGALGQQAELTVLARARFGKAAEMGPRLLSLLHERLAEQGIELAG